MRWCASSHTKKSNRVPWKPHEKHTLSSVVLLKVGVWDSTVHSPAFQPFPRQAQSADRISVPKNQQRKGCCCQYNASVLLLAQQEQPHCRNAIFASTFLQHAAPQPKRSTGVDQEPPRRPRWENAGAVCCLRQDAQTEQGPAAKQRCKAGVLCLVAYMHTYVQGGMDVMMLLTSAFSASSSRVFSSSCDTCRKYRAELGCQCECPPVALCGGQLRATQKQARPNTHGSHSSRSSGLSCVASWWQVGSRHAVTIYPMFTCYH